MSISKMMVGTNHRFKVYTFNTGDGLIRLERRRSWPFNLLRGEWKTLHELTFSSCEQKNYYLMDIPAGRGACYVTDAGMVVCSSKGEWFSSTLTKATDAGNRVFMVSANAVQEIDSFKVLSKPWPLRATSQVFKSEVHMYESPDKQWLVTHQTDMEVVLGITNALLTNDVSETEIVPGPGLPRFILSLKCSE